MTLPTDTETALIRKVLGETLKRWSGTGNPHAVPEGAALSAMLTYGRLTREEAERERDEVVQALTDYRGQQYAPWTDPEPEDTIGAMIDNQAWVMMSHIASMVGHRDGNPDLMERWQDDWATGDMLKGWFSPHRAAAAYVAERLTLRTPEERKPKA